MEEERMDKMENGMPEEEAVTSSVTEAAVKETPAMEEAPVSEEKTAEETKTEPVQQAAAPKQPEKKNSFLGKGVKLVASALVFGAVAGFTMSSIFQATVQKQQSAEETKAPVQIAESKEPERVTVDPEKINVASLLDVSDIVETAMPSIVAIHCTSSYSTNSWFYGNQTYKVKGSGSGIIIGQNEEELLIVTNNHVVESAEDLSVVFIDEKEVAANVKGTDAENDLAVIAVPLSDIEAETSSAITLAKIGDSEKLKVGQGVIAIGNALGYGQSVTVGYVSALNREVNTSETTVKKLIQTDAPINPGNSGGALLNMYGEVIGINSAKYSSTEVEGMGYAIPISKVQDIIDNLMTKRTRIAVEAGQEGYLGIRGLTVDENMQKQLDMPAGVYIHGIIEGGAAASTELHEKDILVKLDGQTVKTMQNLQELLKYYKQGETVSIVVKRLEGGSYEEKELEITLGSKPVSDTAEQENTEEKKEEEEDEQNQGRRNDRGNGSRNGNDGYDFYNFGIPGFRFPF